MKLLWAEWFSKMAGHVLRAILAAASFRRSGTMFIMRADGNLGLAALRVAVATVFIRHGAQKLFVFGFAGVTDAFTHMGVPFPGVTGPLIGLLEFFCGIALAIGFLTRLLAVGFVLDMLGAILLVQLKRGFSGYELEFLLLASSVALFLAGAGRFSVDALLAIRKERRKSAP